MLAAPIVITFDQPMDAASTAAAFSIEPKVPGEVKVQGAQLTFTPTERLKRGAEYRVTVANSAASASGLKLQAPVAFKFVTAGFLEVTSTQPADRATDVPTDATILVGFNRPVVALNAVGTGEGMPLVITPTVAGRGEWINTSIYRFTPTNGLAASTGYSVTVKAGLTDTTGGLLAESFTFGFRTSDPTVTGWRPESTANVRIESPITVTFSMPMERASTEAAFSLVDASRTPVPGLFTWAEGDTALQFKPIQVLKFGETYTATVAATARPANGQGSLRRAAVRSFRTVSLPRVVRTEPRDGDLQASPYGGVRFDFASPMNPASFVTGTITILPAATGVYTSYSPWDDSLFVNFDKQPATAYTITLAGSVADPYGNLLGRDVTVRFTTRDLDPVLQLYGVDRVGTYNAYTVTRTVVTYRNIPQIEFNLYRASADEFIALTGRDSWEAWDKFTPARSNLLRSWLVTTDTPRNVTGVLRTELVDRDGKELPPGLYFLQVGASSEARQGLLSAMRNTPRQLLARTSLNITLKASSAAALAWVTDLRSGQPVAGATVRFTDGQEIDVSAVTGPDGVAQAQLNAAHRYWQPIVALATTPGGGFGVASSLWNDGIAPWDFNVPSGGAYGRYTGYVYTDRPIYRPGQTVYWKAIIRQDDDARFSLPPAGQPVTVTIRDGQGSELLTQRLTLGPLGTTDGQLTLGPEAGLGDYLISLQLADADPEQAPPFSGTFQVAEYRKPEYELSAVTDKPEYIQGEQISVTLQANYFFGGPVKGGKVSWVLLSDNYSFEYRGKETGYSFGDWDWYDLKPRYLGGALSQGEGVTDAQGRFTLRVPADITKFSQSQRFTFDLTVLDLNNQTVSTQASAVVHKGAFYIGVRPQRYVGAVGQPNRVDILTVDTQSRPVPQTSVTAVVNLITWYSVREKAEDGYFYWQSRAEKTPVYTQTLTTDANGKALLEWTPTKGGEYKIEVSGRDRSGHLIRSAAFVWITDREYVNWRQENNDRIELIADRDAYAVGDTAEVLVASPYQGPVKALLTVERDGVLSYEVIEIASNSQVLKLPIRAEHAPNIFVSLVLIKGMDATSPAPSFKIGLKQLKVSVADKELKILLTPRKGTTTAAADGAPLVVGPPDKVTWDLQVLDAAGKPVAGAEVSLALVDKAVLSLAEDRAGPILARFYYERSLGVRTATTLVANVDRLTAQLSLGGKGGGGADEMAGGPAVRREFPDIAFWRAAVTTDSNGKAQVEVTLPDNLTTWTMDARAVTKETLVGQARADIIATKDLLVRPVLPRFFIVDDQAEIAAVVQNNTGRSLDVTVDLKATGLKTPAVTQHKATLPPAAAQKLAWPVTVLPNVEQVVAQMRVAEQGGPLSDAVEITLPVYRYTTPELVGTSGQVGPDEGRLELIRLPADADPTRGELSVTLEPSLAAGMIGGLRYLEHYPYECVEQTMSRFLPNVVSYAALKKLGISRPDLETTLPQQVGVGLQRIYARQNVDGGWGWWAADESNLAVSSYVLFGLARARQAGFTVDRGVFDRAVRFVRNNLKAPRDLSGWQLNGQAFALYALAEAGALEPNRAGALYEVRERLSLYGRGYLALTFGLINDAAAAERIKTLLADLTGKAIVSAGTAHWEEGWTDYWNMNSDTRTSAIILATLARLDPKHTLAPAAVRWLMTARKADRWETTQENAWAIIALTEWMAVTGELEGDYGWQVLLNDATLGQGRVTPATVSQPVTLAAPVGAGVDARPVSGPSLLPGQTNGLVIRRGATGQAGTGKGQLYYTAYLKTFLPADKVQPLSRGVTISRQYTLADCQPTSQPTNQPTNQPANQPTNQPTNQPANQPVCPPITQARVGDVINVRLTIVVPRTLNYLVVEDPLPAGTEAIDVSLRTTSRTAQGPEVEKVPGAQNGAGSARSWWWDWWWTPTHTELRDEKTALFATSLTPGTYEFTYQVRASLPGRFLTLPPTAYQMYAPDVWGRGAGGVFTITE